MDTLVEVPVHFFVKMSRIIDQTITWRIVTQPLLTPVFRWLALGVLAATALVTPGPLSVDLCILHRTTGLPCPGCGVTRGLMHLAHGEWSEALGANPWALLVWPLLAAMALSLLVPEARMERFNAWIARREPWPSKLVRVLLLAFFGFGLLRLGWFVATSQRFP